MGNKQQILIPNILVVGFPLILNKVEPDWAQDQNNSSVDFKTYTNSIEKKALLWCPQEGTIFTQTVESLILNLEIEGLIYILEYQFQELSQHRKIIHKLMSEDAMRQCSLTLIALYQLPTTSESSEIFIKELIEQGLSLETLDSKQPRHLRLERQDVKDIDFNNIIKQTLRQTQP
ncbi:hypothetical protein pb186bvf_017180 [Paramecium bursaria]